MNNILVPIKREVKYLGLHLDQTLPWKTYIKAKRLQLKVKLKNLYLLTNKKSKLSVENKLTSIKQYSSQFWHTASSYGDAANHPAQKYSKLLNQELSG
jgi:hypothetical protein